MDCGDRQLDEADAVRPSRDPPLKTLKFRACQSPSSCKHYWADDQKFEWYRLFGFLRAGH